MENVQPVHREQSLSTANARETRAITSIIT